MASVWCCSARLGFAPRSPIIGATLPHVCFAHVGVGRAADIAAGRMIFR